LDFFGELGIVILMERSGDEAAGEGGRRRSGADTTGT